MSWSYTLLGSQTIIERIYGRANLLEDVEFVEIVSDDGGSFVVSLKRLQDVR